MKLIITTIFLLTFGCSQKDSFELKEGVFYKNGTPFTGLYKTHNGSTKKEISYNNGLKDGDEKHFYKSGQLYKHLKYKEGKHTGIHYWFYESGKKRKEIHFSNGVHHGDYIEWFESGKVHVYTKYENGVSVGHKKWRRNGRIYANYVLKDGKKMGLNGGKLCFTTEDKKEDSI